MSKSDEEIFTDIKSGIVAELKEKTKSNVNIQEEVVAAIAVEQMSKLSPTEGGSESPTTATAACSISQQQQLTPKSHNSRRSSKSNKSNFKKAAKKSSRGDTKEAYFDATSLNSTSSMNADEHSIYSSANNNTNNNFPNLIVANTTPLVLPLPPPIAAPILSSGGGSFQSNAYVDNVITKDPIVIRGAGNITIFGVCNKFNEQFPTQLNAKLAPEEFRDTIKQINSILNKELENSFKWLVFGSIFCCCTLGCSLLPVIYMNKKAKLCISKLLDMENQRLYLKLGLKWRLAKLKCNSNSLLEYVLLIEFLPTLLLYQPD